MNRAVRFSLAAGAVLLVCACTGDSLNPPPGQTIQASLSDGAHSGNPDFFFLPPIFGNPVNDPNFEPNAFNANVRPTVEICELAILPVPPATTRACVPGTPFKSFTASDVNLDVTGQKYQVNWDTRSPSLALTKEYRIRVLLGTHELGHADIDPVMTGSALKNVVTGEFIGLVDGRTLPIKFRIENGAACDGGDCDSKTVDLTQGGSVVLATSGDRVDIPAQPSGQVVTVTVKLCAGLLVDLPKFGNCLTVTADPPLRAPLSPPATISMCSLHDNIPSLVHAQQDLVTLHRQDITSDGTLITALPHSRDFCPAPIGAAPLPPARNWIDAGWRAVRHGVASLFGVRPLHAASAMLDVGGGGETPNFSDFQFALPAKMQIASIVDQLVAPNIDVPSPPSVLVTDAADRPVGGARVHFHITSTTGGSLTPTDGVVLSDPVTGRATLTAWHVADPATYTVTASGFGIADPLINGPAEGFDPFAPAVFPGNPGQDEAQAEVKLGTGHLSYSATAGGQPDLTIDGIVVGPSDLTFADDVTYDVTVRNHGTGAAPATTVSLDGPSALSGDDVGTDVLQVPALSPGAAATVRSRLPPRLPGTSSAVATVDPNNTVAESNEQNNTFTTEPFTVAPKIDFETLGDGTPISSIALPLALVNDYALQNVAFSFVRADQTPGVGSLCNSRGADPTGVTDNHSASIEASGDPCNGFTQGALSLMFARSAGLPSRVQFQLRGNNGIDPFPISGVDGAGNAVIVTRSGVSTYTSNNGFTARQETVEVRSLAGIVQITMNLPAATGAVFLDDLVIIR